MDKADRIAPWIAVVFSALAAIGGLWSAWESRDQARIAAEEAALDSQVALVRACGTFTKAAFRVGDDMLELHGSDGSKEYTSSLEVTDFYDAISNKPERFLRCDFTNDSRVPLLTVTFSLRAGFHHGRKPKWEHSFPFEALAPGQSRRVWILNTDNSPIAVRNAERARYVRFPYVTKYQDQTFQPVLGDYWILYRDFDPDEHLDNSML
jgi:hypothetical protein